MIDIQVNLLSEGLFCFSLPMFLNGLRFLKLKTKGQAISTGNLTENYKTEIKIHAGLA